MKVSSEELIVTFQLPVGVTPEAARAALRMTGPVVPSVTDWAAGQPQSVQLRYPPGQPGEQFEVRMINPAGTALDLGFHLERVTTPGITADWRRSNGEWLPLTDRIANLPRQPVLLRFRLRGQVPHEAVEELLVRQGLPKGVWTAPDDLEVTLATPPAHVFLDFDAIATKDHLRTAHSIWEIFFGQPPQLVAIDPISGLEEQIGEAPLNVDYAHPSPDGNWVALLSVHPDSPHAQEAWVMNTATGRRLRLGTKAWWPGSSVFWSPLGLLIDHDGKLSHWRPGDDRAVVVETKASDYVAISPDGRYLAGYVYNMPQTDNDRMAPGSVVLYDIATRQERFLAVDQVKVRIPLESPPVLQMEFSPDGQGLFIREITPGRDHAFRWLRLDLRTETLAEAPDYDLPAVPRWLVNAKGYQATQSRQYQAVRIKAPNDTEKSYGTGLVAGWLPDGRLLLIRWENGANLRRIWSPM